MSTDLEFSVHEQLLATVVSICAGALLYELVEVQFRLKRGASDSQKSQSLFASFVIGFSALAISVGYWAHQGFPKRVNAEVREATGDIASKWEIRHSAVRDGICSLTTSTARFSNYDRKTCSSPPAYGRSYLVVGDSFANDSMLVLKTAYPDIYFGQLTVPGCLLRLPRQFGRGEQIECRKLYDLAFSGLIHNPHYDGIVLSSNWQDRHYYRINDMINVLDELDLDIIVIGQRLRFKDRLPSIVSSSENLVDARARANAFISAEEFNINQIIIERFSERIKVIDFINLACPNSCDIADRSGQLMYMDDSHLSLAGVRVLADRLKKERPDL